MQIYNAGSNRNTKRFMIALAAGLGAAIVLGVLYGILSSILRVQIQILYIGIGYLIGLIIQKTGHGLTQQYCILGAICTFLTILIGDCISMFGLSIGFAGIFHPSMWGTFLQSWLSIYLSTNINSLLGLIFRAVGIYSGYHYSVIF